MISNCYYINLDRRPDRKKFVESELNKSDLLRSIIQRFPAVDGSKIHPWYVEKGLLSRNAIDDILSENVSAWGLSVTQGGLGVILSYQSLFKEIENLSDSVITFEDDICLGENFDERLKQILSELPKDFDICYLGYGETKIESENYSKNLSKPLGRIVCLPALIISPSGAKKILGLMKNLDNQIDTAISGNFRSINAFIAKNPLVKIRNHMSSDIQGDINCRKQYKLQNFIFSTMAIGDIHVKRAMALAQDMKYFNQKLLIVTDQPNLFGDMSNVIVVKYAESRFSYNHKIICFEEGFKIADGVVYIDCDCRIIYKTYKNTMSCFSLILAQGFHRSWDWGLVARSDGKFFESKDIRGRCEGYGELALQTCKDLEIEYEKAFHYQEGIIAIAKENGKENIFIETWKKLSAVLDAHEIKMGSDRIGLGEGNLVGLALVKSGMTVNSTDVCNIIGESVKYNFYGQNINDQMKLSPGRKMVETSEYEKVKSVDHYVDFNGKQIDLSLSVYNVNETVGMISFTWNKNNVVEFLDHEFSINGTIYHFQSEKTNNFYYNRSSELSIEHTYDWYGERKWIKIV